MNTPELLGLLNLFQQHVPGDIYQDYYNVFSRMDGDNPWYFPGTMLYAISDMLRQKKVIIGVGDPDSWRNLFEDLCTRFKTVRTHLAGRMGISSHLKTILEHTEKYCEFVHKCLADNRSELFQYLARWGINCLDQLTNIIDDNVLIKGAGPVGLVTAYFLQKSVPNLKIVLCERRADYTRNYHVLLAEDTFDTLPYEIKKGLWGYGKYGCYILPPPIDAKGYCYINPPVNQAVPDHYYSTIYPNEYFDVDPISGRRTFKKLMSIPIGVFQEAMTELIKIKHPNIKIIKPTAGSKSEYSLEIVDNAATGLNKCGVKDSASGEIVAKSMFSNDAIYNYVIDASGAQGIPTSRRDTANPDIAMTILVKSNLDNLKQMMTDDNISMRPTQDSARYFSSNERWSTALLSIRNLPFVDEFRGAEGEVKWTDLSKENQTFINDEYKKYTGKDIDPAEIQKITWVFVEIANRGSMFEKYDNIYKIYVGDSGCAVHFFSGTGINNGIRMATKLTETMNRAYQSRWKYDPAQDLQKWSQEMNTMCEETLKKSRNLKSRV